MDENNWVNRRLVGWIGTACLLLIIPIKVLRVSDSAGVSLAAGVAPSILGPPGLLFLLLSDTGRISRLTLTQTTVLTGAIAVGLELMQALPRPGILNRVNYTFDYLDLAATLFSLVIAYGIIRVAFQGRPRE